jgi:hypothetical protein
LTHIEKRRIAENGREQLPLTPEQEAMQKEIQASAQFEKDFPWAAARQHRVSSNARERALTTPYDVQPDRSL